MADLVNHPDHYGGADNPYEAIKVVEAWSLNFCLGNVVKYISRAGKKGDVLEDLKKARWYLDREVENQEKGKVAAQNGELLWSPQHSQQSRRLSQRAWRERSRVFSFILAASKPMRR